MKHQTGNQLNVIIVDDEQLACSNLSSILNHNAALNISGIAHNTRDAEELISTALPDAVFMDIDMPGENAFQMLDRIYPFTFDVVFVTAFNEFAIKAFKLNAADYILKPVNTEEVMNAVIRLRERKTYKQYTTGNGAGYQLLSRQLLRSEGQNKLVLKDNAVTEIVDFKDICFIEAKGSYSRICFLKGNEEKNIVMSRCIAEYEALLPTDMFYRIHKSYLINCIHIGKIQRKDNSFVSVNKHTLPIGRRRYTAMMQFLKNSMFS